MQRPTTEQVLRRRRGCSGMSAPTRKAENQGQEREGDLKAGNYH